MATTSPIDAGDGHPVALRPTVTLPAARETLPAPAHGVCRNCETPLVGRYCSACGQREVVLRPTLIELLHEAFHEFSHVDGKIFRTLGLLVFRPGQLTREFLDGQRARSVTPIRVYLLASVLFFGTMAMLPAPRNLRVTLTKGDPALTRAAERVNRDPSVLANALETAFPKAMFVLMPLFGLIVYAFYWPRERMYVPHFYFAVHFHAFAFVVYALFEAATSLHWRPMIVPKAVLLLAPLPYLTVALRRVYGGGWLMTVAKTTGIVAIELVLVMLAMAAIAYVTLLRFA